MLKTPQGPRKPRVVAPRPGSKIRAACLRARRKELDADFRLMSPEERLADVDLERLAWCTLAPSTRTRYAQALDAMLKFTAELGLDPNSADDVGLAFRRYLIESEVKQMAATTVRIRFYAVLKWDLGRGIDMTNHWSNNPLVRAAIAGYCRNDLNLRTKEVRFPYSVGMVIQLQTEAERLGELDIAWGFELLFHGGMRSGHLEREEDGFPKFRKCDVRIVPARDGTSVCQVTLRAIKGRAQRTAAATIIVPANVGHYITATPGEPWEPALPGWNSSLALQIIDRVAVEKGWDPNYVYDLHAFRRAMASHMVANGCTQEQIRLQGLWAKNSMIPFTTYAMLLFGDAAQPAACQPRSPLDRLDEGSRRTLPFGSPTWPHRQTQPRQPHHEHTMVSRGVLPTAGPATGGVPGVTPGTVTGRATETIEWESVAAQTTVGGREESASTGRAMGGARATGVRKYTAEQAWWRE